MRDMVRAGVDRDVAMSISGHKTEAIFRRYNLVTDQDRREAALKLREWHARLQDDGRVKCLRERK